MIPNYQLIGLQSPFNWNAAHTFGCCQALIGCSLNSFWVFDNAFDLLSPDLSLK